jgi:hypothetical protein
MIINGGFLTMGTKRVGMARVKSLINENVNQMSRKFRRVIEVNGTRELLASESGASVYWTKGSAHTVTLPAAEAGLNFKIVIKVSSDNLHKVAAAAGDCFFGKVVVRSSNVTHDSAIQEVTYATATTTVANFDHLHIDGNVATTGSGVGSVIELECIDGVAWRVTADLTSSQGTLGTIATITAS